MEQVLKESKDFCLRVDSTTTEVPERIAVVEDEETELIGEDATDTPRQQICKKRRRWRGCVLYFSDILGFVYFKTCLEQVSAIMGHSKLLGDSLGENFCGFYCRRDKDLAFCKSARQVSDVQLASLSLVQQECCLFVFLDGSAHYFDDFLKVLVLLKMLSSQARTGEYRLQPGRVNGRPHYVRYNTTSVQLIPSLCILLGIHV